MGEGLPTITAEPKSIRVTRYVCPGCRWSNSRRAVVVDHMTRCWRVPENRACLTCAHFDAGRCCPTASAECGCRGEADWECQRGITIETGRAEVGCESWQAASWLGTPDSTR